MSVSVSGECNAPPCKHGHMLKRLPVAFMSLNPCQTFTERLGGHDPVA